MGVCLGVGSEAAARKAGGRGPLYQAGLLPVPGWSATEEGQGLQGARGDLGWTLKPFKSVVLSKQGSGCERGFLCAVCRWAVPPELLALGASRSLSPLLSCCWNSSARCRSADVTVGKARKASSFSMLVAAPGPALSSNVQVTFDFITPSDESIEERTLVNLNRAVSKSLWETGSHYPNHCVLPRTSALLCSIDRGYVL